jgi:biopolymer transport protein ExbD
VLQKQLQVASLVEIVFTILIAFLVLIVFNMYTRLNRLTLQFEESIQHRAQEQSVMPQKRKKKKK